MEKRCSKFVSEYSCLSISGKVVKDPNEWYTDLFQSDSEYDGPVSITLYHSTSLGLEPEWHERGHIIIQNVVTGDMSVTQKPVDALMAKSLQVY